MPFKIKKVRNKELWSIHWGSKGKKYYFSTVKGLHTACQKSMKQFKAIKYSQSI